MSDLKDRKKSVLEGKLTKFLPKSFRNSLHVKYNLPKVYCNSLNDRLILYSLTSMRTRTSFGYLTGFCPAFIPWMLLSLMENIIQILKFYMVSLGHNMVVSHTTIPMTQGASWAKLLDIKSISTNLLRGRFGNVGWVWTTKDELAAPIDPPDWPKPTNVT